MLKLALVIVWFIATPVFLFALSLYSSKNQNISPISSAIDTEQAQTLENNIEGQVLGVKIEDARPFIVAKFLNGTKLESYSEQIIQASDKYGIDYRFIPAIAMKESQGGNTARAGSYNAWGWENGRTNFSSWESAIETVAKTLKERYIAKGLTTPDLMMPIYAPPQVYTGGKWAKDINLFFSKMETL